VPEKATKITRTREHKCQAIKNIDCVFIQNWGLGWFLHHVENLNTLKERVIATRLSFARTADKSCRYTGVGGVMVSEIKENESINKETLLRYIRSQLNNLHREKDRIDSQIKILEMLEAKVEFSNWCGI